MTIPASRRDELRRLAVAATPGPWSWSDANRMEAPVRLDDFGAGLEEVRDTIIETDGGYYPPNAHDRSFIAASRTAVPDLLDEIERLEKERDLGDRMLSEAAPFEARQGARITALETALSVANTVAGEAALVLEQQDRDLDRLRAALGEALDMWCDETGVLTSGVDDNYDRLRKVLG